MVSKTILGKAVREAAIAADAVLRNNGIAPDLSLFVNIIHVNNTCDAQIRRDLWTLRVHPKKYIGSKTKRLMTK